MSGFFVILAVLLIFTGVAMVIGFWPFACILVGVGILYRVASA